MSATVETTRPDRGSYLLAGRASELERLQLQSRVWEPSARRLLDQIGDGTGARVVDVGCGPMGWLRALSEWVGPEGEVVGTDLDDAMLGAARDLVEIEGLGNVRLVKDDLFATELDPSSFDLVHARFQLAPLGRVRKQTSTYVRLARPGGTVVLEDLDTSSWHYIPPAPALQGMIPLLAEAFRRAGGDPDAAFKHLDLLRELGIEPIMRAEIQTLPPGHPYQRLPLVFATALRELLLSIVDGEELKRLEEGAERELADQERYGLTFTLIQTWGRRPAADGAEGDTA